MLVLYGTIIKYLIAGVSYLKKIAMITVSSLRMRQIQEEVRHAVCTVLLQGR